MIENFNFYAGLSLIVLHEMDAIRCREWRIFPGLSLLSGPWGFRVFMLLHIPLFYFLFWKLGTHGPNKDLILGLDIFFIIHFGLHVLFLMHKKNEFKGRASWTIITGAALFGLLDLLQH